MANLALKKITDKAKILYRTGKYKKWTDAIKAASKVGDYKINKATFLEKNIPTSPRKKTTKKPKSFIVKRDTSGQFSKIKRIPNISGLKKYTLGTFFDTSVIKDIDNLKKEYFKLAKKYHPDAGGTTSQFQQLQAEYEKMFKALLNGSTFTTEQKNNETVIDKAIRDIIDAIVNYEGIDIELIGKWLWVGSTTMGFTTPMYNALKSAGLTYLKKAGKPYMVYKGIESKSKGGTTMDEIKKKYGVQKFEANKLKKLSGYGTFNKSKLVTALKKLKLALNKRPI